MIKKNKNLIVVTEIPATFSENFSGYIIGATLFSTRLNEMPIKNNIFCNYDQNGDAINSNFEKVNFYYERVLEDLLKYFNNYHCSNFDIKFWRIMIGPWLHTYISAMFERYLEISSINKNWNNLSFIGLNKNNYSIAEDTLSYTDLLREDFFNLQLYTEIIKFLDIPITKYINLNNKMVKARAHTGFFKKCVKYIYIKIFNILRKIIDPKIVIHQSYFPNFWVFLLFFRSKGRVLPLVKVDSAHLAVSESYNKIDFRKDDTFVTIFDEFTKLISITINKQIPTVFLENYKSIVDYEHNYPSKIRIIFSSTAWMFDEPFKYWSAKQNFKYKTQLLGIQHGGDYGIMKIMPNEDHELKILDKFYSWGWKENCMKVVPMPSNKILLQNKLQKKLNNKINRILFVTSTYPKYFFRYPHNTKDYLKSIHNQIALFDSLDANIFSKLVWRPHYADLGWLRTNYIKENSLNKKLPTLEFWDKNFWESLQNSDIYIADHMSTTYAQALSINKPTLLYWDFNANHLRPRSKPIFDKFLDLNILFDCPIKVAQMINSLDGTLADWWSNEERQSAINEFLALFCSNPTNGCVIWQKEFNRMLSNAN